MSQPVWKLSHSLGDHGNIYVDETGVYAPEAEVWEAYEPEDYEEFPDDVCADCDETRAQHTKEAGGTGDMVSRGACTEFTELDQNRVRFLVYRVPLDRYSMYKGPSNTEQQIIPYGFHLRNDLPHPIESYVEWFSKDLGNVANYVDTTRQTLVEALCSADPLTRFHAYKAIADYHGWRNFDDYPLDGLSEKDLKIRQQEQERTFNQKQKQKHRIAAHTTPHGRCDTYPVCIEHVQDPRVPSCKKTGSQKKNRGKGRKLM